MKQDTLTTEFKYVWLNLNNGVFSNSWDKEQQKLVGVEIINQSKKQGWKLLEYRCLNAPEFDLYNKMKIVTALSEHPETKKEQPLSTQGEGVGDILEGITAGNWEVRHYKAKDVFIVWGNDKRDSLQAVADIKYTNEPGLSNVMQGEKEAEANARLIASAPQLALRLKQLEGENEKLKIYMGRLLYILECERTQQGISLDLRYQTEYHEAKAALNNKPD